MERRSPASGQAPTTSLPHQPPKHKVIALISGGKDSLFSLLHCLANGHDVVALANLYPPRPGRGDGNEHAVDVGRPAYDREKRERTGDEDDADDDDDGPEDIDSYMYQTVGHGVVPLYEACLGIPLYREPIRGGARDTRREYAARGHAPSVHDGDGGLPRREPLDDDDGAEADETESLVPLLRRVLRAHPAATAVSSGAILSTYQRTRIESVARRLGLVPLAFLWQFPLLPGPSSSSTAAGGRGGGGGGAGLLRDMAAVGFEARIVKVASGGLDERLLWEDLVQERVWRWVKRAMERVAGGGGRLEVGAVLGEGGEFETLVLDGPAPVWKRRIEVPAVSRVVGEGGSAVVKIKRARTVEKPRSEDSLEDLLVRVRKPAGLDPEFEEVLKSLGSAISGERAEQNEVHPFPSAMAGDGHLLPSEVVPLPTIARYGSIVRVSNIASRSRNTFITDEIEEIVSSLSSILSSTELSTTPSSIVSTTILLRHMPDFEAVNAVYGTLFTEPLPPARITVACGDRLPSGVNLALSVVLDLDAPKRRQEARMDGLHVQSWSYWAPANIGPYSQAISVPLSSFVRQTDRPAAVQDDDDEMPAERSSAESAKLFFLAGQIPLVPSTMTLASPSSFFGSSEKVLSSSMSDPSFELDAVLALQHLFRIGRATAVRFWTSGLAFLADAPAPLARQRARIAAAAWKGAHEHAWQRWRQRRRRENSSDDGNNDDGGENAQPDIDVWDLRNRVGRLGRRTLEDEDGANEDEPSSIHRRDLPDYSLLASPPADAAETPLPAFFAVQVSQLPRGASIECTAGAGGIAFDVSSGRDELLRAGTASLERRAEALAGGSLSAEATVLTLRDGAAEHRFTTTALRCAANSGRAGAQQGSTPEAPGSDGLLRLLERLCGPAAEGLHTVYLAEDAEGSGALECATWLRAGVVPCRSIWDGGGKRMAVLVVSHCCVQGGEMDL